MIYNVSEKHILLSGDIELNPGPVSNNRTLCNDSSDFLFNYRLLKYGLRLTGVGGGDDCFFRSISQLYSSSSCHLQIRITGINYLRDHPEQFIKTNVERSWARYVTNMSKQGTLAYHISYI